VIENQFNVTITSASLEVSYKDEFLYKKIEGILEAYLKRRKKINRLIKSWLKASIKKIFEHQVIIILQ